MLEINLVLNVLVGIIAYKVIVTTIVIILKTLAKNAIAHNMTAIANDSSLDITAKSKALEELYDMYKKAE